MEHYYSSELRSQLSRHFGALRAPEMLQRAFQSIDELYTQKLWDECVAQLDGRINDWLGSQTRSAPQLAGLVARRATGERPTTSPAGSIPLIPFSGFPQYNELNEWEQVAFQCDWHFSYDLADELRTAQEALSDDQFMTLVNALTSEVGWYFVARFSDRLTKWLDAFQRSVEDIWRQT